MNPSLIAVDIGNSFLHLARYELPADKSAAGPQPLAWPNDDAPQMLRLSDVQQSWPKPLPTEPVEWAVVAVHRAREQSLQSWVQSQRPQDVYRRLQNSDFGLRLDVHHPEKVGCDRVAAARAAYEMRRQQGAVIVVDLGSAVTVDLVDARGAFRGGSIFPGRFMLADALHRHTDALPLVDAPPAPPSMPAVDTQAAIQAGIYWGTVGAVRELVNQLQRQAGEPCELFVTGGGQAPDLLSEWKPCYVADLVLRGAAWAAQDRRS